MKNAKKFLFLLIFACLAAGMTACSSNTDEETPDETNAVSTAPMFETALIQTSVSAAETTTTSDTNLTETTTSSSEETSTTSEESTTVTESTTTTEVTSTTTEETTAETTTTTEETTATTETTTTVTTADMEAAPETAPQLTTETTAVVSEQLFTPGIWWATSSNGDRYFCFYANSNDGSLRDQESGMGLGFNYEADGSAIVFHIGDTADNTAASVSFTDSRNAVLTWASGNVEFLTYQGLGNFDTFRYYSNLELCEMALDYYEARNGYRPADAAAAIQPDNQIIIQLYDNLGDHNSTSAWYTVDRFTAQGTDMLGNAINLAES